MPAMRKLGACRHPYRLVARDANGERTVGEYTFDPTPTLT
jgi:hypothetical protein